MLARKLLRSALGAAVYLQMSQTPAAEDRLAVQATVRITIESRNGGELLARSLEALSRMQADARFAGVLARDETPGNVTSECLSLARRDASGRVFDVARCIELWPAEGRAPMPKRFEDAFGAPVMLKGASAFPAAKVAPFEFQLRLRPTQIPGGQRGAWFTADSGDLGPTPALTQVLCNPRVTYVDQKYCDVKVVSRLDIYEPDIYVPQTGYRVTLVRSVDVDLAEQLRSELVEKIELPKGTPRSAVRVTVIRQSEGESHQQLIQPGQEPGKARRIAALWRALGASPAALDMTSAPETPPALLVFDKIKLDRPISIGEWLTDVSRGTFRAEEAECPDSGQEGSHLDAVTSLLFPQAMLNRFTQSELGKGAFTEPQLPEWDGYFLSTEHFSGAISAIDEQMWYQAYAASGKPLMGLVVFSSDLGTAPGGAVATAAAYLSDPSNLLVISAPQKDKSGRVQKFASNASEPTTHAATIEALCEGRSWPSCLGRHPRVIVVAPSTFPRNGQDKPALFEPNKYVLGASTVRIAAPGGNIPVVRRCGAPANEWGIGVESGTSFAAPLVALVLSRLIQTGPPEVRYSLPEAAIWRILATAQPFGSVEGIGSPHELAEFGELNAGLALTGASAEEIGHENSAVVYTKKGSDVISQQRVVMSYPWNDYVQNTQILKQDIGIRKARRGFLTLQQYAASGALTRRETVEVNRFLRIMRRPDDHLNGSPLFDVFLITPTTPGSMIDGSSNSGAKPTYFVEVRKRVRFSPGNSVSAPGFCRDDGESLGGGPGVPPQPACFYILDASDSAGQFAPLDLNTVVDIVFPTLHKSSYFPRKIVPTEMLAVTSKKSPWRTAFCSTGPRPAIRDLLAKLKQPDWEEACSRK